jgi:hypothetical protein
MLPSGVAPSVRGQIYAPFTKISPLPNRFSRLLNAFATQNLVRTPLFLI